MADEHCKCPIRPKMSYDELTDEILTARKMCTDVLNKPGAGWMCSTLLLELKRADTERGWRKRQAKKMKHEGFTEDQIKKSVSKPKRIRGQVGILVDLDLSEFGV